MAQVKEGEKIQKSPKKVSREELEREAYFHWLNRGCPVGDSLTDWVEVEKEFAPKLGAKVGERSR
jgi:hypothetical protein